MTEALTVRRCAAGLPIEESHALWLVDVCGRTYAEAADEVSTDRQTIAERISRGRRRLRLRLESADEAEMGVEATPSPPAASPPRAD